MTDSAGADPSSEQARDPMARAHEPVARAHDPVARAHDPVARAQNPTARPRDPTARVSARRRWARAGTGGSRARVAALNRSRPAPRQPSPRTPRGLRRFLTLPAFWLLAALLLVGLVRIAQVLRAAFAAYPVATAAAVGIFALYAVPFVLLVRGIDFLDREPPVLLATAFAWGGLVATTISITGSAAAQNLVAKWISPDFAASWGAAVAGATVEETAKVLGVVMLALVARAWFTSVIDGFVYGALIGLGFQVVENIVFSMDAVAMNGQGDKVQPVLVTLLLRGFLGGLWSHTLFTALTGAGVAYLVVRTDLRPAVRYATAAGCFLAGWAAHFVWNSPLLADGLGFGALGVLIGLLVKGVPALLVAVALIRAAERREATYFAGVLAGLGDPRVATPREIVALTSPSRRVGARRSARIRLGAGGARAVRRLQRAQARLAVALSRDRRSEAARRWREVLLRRHELLALGVSEAVAPMPRRRHFALGNTGAFVAEIIVLGIAAIGITLVIGALRGG
jgi:RsiW-degrading membrane proteinase PrsW (M82 family)